MSLISILSWVYTSDFRMRFSHCVAIFYNLPWFSSIKVSNKKLQCNAENACGNRMCKCAFRTWIFTFVKLVTRANSLDVQFRSGLRYLYSNLEICVSQLQLSFIMIMHKCKAMRSVNIIKYSIIIMSRNNFVAKILLRLSRNNFGTFKCIKNGRVLHYLTQMYAY